MQEFLDHDLQFIRLGLQFVFVYKTLFGTKSCVHSDLNENAAHMENHSTVVVIPCFNEEQRLDVGSYWRFLRSNPEYSFAFVNDGSTDATETKLRTLQRRCPDRVSIVSLSTNCGKAEAVRLGILNALRIRPSYVAYWDADLATPLDELPRFQQTLRRLSRVNMVIGIRMALKGHQINRLRFRRTLGKLFSFAASCMLSTSIRDTQCGAKMFRVTPQLSRVFESSFISRWIFDVEVFARMKNCPGFDDNSLFELPVTNWNEVAGSRLAATDCFNAIGELISIGWKYRLGRRDCLSIEGGTEFSERHVPAASRRAA